VQPDYSFGPGFNWAQRFVNAEDYTTEEQAVAHVRRLLDIVACTTAFAKHKSSKHGRPATPPSPPAPASSGAGHGGAAPPPPISEAHDMAAIRPCPKLGEFYDFFSFAHLTPPFHCKASLTPPDEAPHLHLDCAFWHRQNVGFDRAVIKKKETSGASKEGDYFEIEVFGIPT
jgi:protein TIF31